MPNASNRPPRFLPTLTEVVEPSTVAVSAPGPVAQTPSSSEVEEIIERVMQRLEASLEPRLREWVTQAVAEEINARQGR